MGFFSVRRCLRGTADATAASAAAAVDDVSTPGAAVVDRAGLVLAAGGLCTGGIQGVETCHAPSLDPAAAPRDEKTHNTHDVTKSPAVSRVGRLYPGPMKATEGTRKHLRGTYGSGEQSGLLNLLTH